MIPIVYALNSALPLIHLVSNYFQDISGTPMKILFFLLVLNIVGTIAYAVQKNIIGVIVCVFGAFIPANMLISMSSNSKKRTGTKFLVVVWFLLPVIFAGLSKFMPDKLEYLQKFKKSKKNGDKSSDKDSDSDDKSSDKDSDSDEEEEESTTDEESKSQKGSEKSKKTQKVSKTAEKESKPQKEPEKSKKAQQSEKKPVQELNIYNIVYCPMMGHKKGGQIIKEVSDDYKKRLTFKETQFQTDCYGRIFQRLAAEIRLKLKEERKSNPERLEQRITQMQLYYMEKVVDYNNMTKLTEDNCQELIKKHGELQKLWKTQENPTKTYLYIFALMPEPKKKQTKK